MGGKFEPHFIGNSTSLFFCAVYVIVALRQGFRSEGKYLP